MKIIDPKNLEEIYPPVQPVDNNEDKYLKGLDWWANRVANTVFIPLEFIVGVLIYAVLLISIWNIFLNPNLDYITKAKIMIEFITVNWIGFLFILPLIFFRLIILKITNLKDAKGVVFGEGVTLYKTGNHNG